MPSRRRGFSVGRLRSFVPPGQAWLRLVAAPTSYVLLLSFLFSVRAKLHVLTSVQDPEMELGLILWVIAPDAGVCFGLAALFAAAEGSSARLRFVTYPIAALVGALSLIGSWYLSVTGDMLTFDVLELGVARFGDVWKIASEAVGHDASLAAVAVLMAAFPPAGARLVLRSSGRSDPGACGMERGHAAALVFAAGVVLALCIPAPASPVAVRVRPNTAFLACVTWAKALRSPAADEKIQPFGGYRVPYLTRQEDLAAFAATAEKKNVLFLVLESVRWDYTSLPPPAEQKGARTPNLAALAKRGSLATRTRAVVPHTTKSIFSVLCGRYPALQLEIVEVDGDLRVQCLPAVLDAAGYRTAFFQSALGSFEDRARLVDKLGFAHFEAFEDIGGEKLGYLASDDLTLVEPVARWIDTVGDRPFFVTVLTSATHHPYRLPTWLRDKARSEGRATGTDAQRYALLVEAQDLLLGKLLAVLDERGLRERTLVVVLSDHGEGFGEKGIRQHDCNWYEQGLHVPVVIAGPGVPRGMIHGNTSLLDVVPTVMGRLGVPVAEEAREEVPGVDWFAGPIPVERAITFSCWHPERCWGFVLGWDKAVFFPRRRLAWHFDLQADPAERSLGRIPERLYPLAKRMSQLIQSYRTRGREVRLARVDRYSRWNCRPASECVHENEEGQSTP